MRSPLQAFSLTLRFIGKNIVTMLSVKSNILWYPSTIVLFTFDTMLLITWSLSLGIGLPIISNWVVLDSSNNTPQCQMFASGMYPHGEIWQHWVCEIHYPWLWQLRAITIFPISIYDNKVFWIFKILVVQSLSEWNTRGTRQTTSIWD